MWEENYAPFSSSFFYCKALRSFPKSASWLRAEDGNATLVNSWYYLGSLSGLIFGLLFKPNNCLLVF